MTVESPHSDQRCEICRRSDNLGRHMTERLVRGERSCNAAAEDSQHGWIFLCGLCHGSVHRIIESTPELADIQVGAVEQVLARVERAFLGPRRGRRSASSTSPGKRDERS